MVSFQYTNYNNILLFNLLIEFLKNISSNKHVIEQVKDK